MLKNSFVAAVAVALFASLAAPLAIAQQERDALEVIRAQIATKRQALVAENMQLSETSVHITTVYWDWFHLRFSIQVMFDHGGSLGRKEIQKPMAPAR